MHRPWSLDRSDPLVGSDPRTGDDRCPDRDADIIAAYLAYAGRLTAFAIAAVHDRDNADDLVAETFLRFLREARAGRMPDHVGAWLYHVCANLIISRGRRATVASRALPRLLDDPDADSPEACALRHDLNDRTVAALCTLPLDARVALLMAAEGYDMRSVGAAIGRTSGATRTYVCRSRGRLRDALDADDGQADAEAGVVDSSVAMSVAQARTSSGRR